MPDGVLDTRAWKVVEEPQQSTSTSTPASTPTKIDTSTWQVEQPTATTAPTGLDTSSWKAEPAQPTAPTPSVDDLGRIIAPDALPTMTVTARPPPTPRPFPYTQVTEPPTEAPSWWDSITGGFQRGIEAGNATLTGNAFTDVPPPSPTPEPGFVGKLLGGIAESSPTLAAGALGVAGGGAIGGPPGAVVGGILGGAGGSIVQSLAPAYREARQAGLDHDAAVNRAIDVAGVQGVVGGAMGGVASWAPFKSVISNLLAQTFGAQPMVGAAGRLATGAVTGDTPNIDQMMEGYLLDATTGGAFAGVHALRRGYQDWRNTPVTTEVNPDRNMPTPPAPEQIPGPPTPGDQVVPPANELVVTPRPGAGAGDAPVPPVPVPPAPVPPAPVPPVPPAPTPAATADPPVPPGMTRLYHGSATPGRYDGNAWFTTDRTYAQNYRPGSELQYVDMPTDWVNARADPDGYGQTPDKGFTFHVELNSDVTGPRQPLVAQPQGELTAPAPAPPTPPPPSVSPGDAIAPPPSPPLPVPASPPAPPAGVVAAPLQAAPPAPAGSDQEWVPVPAGEAVPPSVPSADAAARLSSGTVAPDTSFVSGDTAARAKIDRFDQSVQASLDQQAADKAAAAKMSASAEPAPSETSTQQGTQQNVTEPPRDTTAIGDVAPGGVSGGGAVPELQPAGQTTPAPAAEPVAVGRGQAGVTTSSKAISDTFDRFTAQAQAINKGTMNDAARRGDKPADATLLWFLDGDKSVYFNTDRSQNLYHRGNELAGFQSIPIDVPGETVKGRVWFKPGQRAQAELVAKADAMPPGPERHRALGLALGYPPEEVENYVRGQKSTAAEPISKHEGDRFAEPDEPPFAEEFGDDGEDQVRDVTKARVPADQPEVDSLNKQLANLRSKIANTEKPRELVKYNDQLRRLTAKRNNLLGSAMVPRLEARGAGPMGRTRKAPPTGGGRSIPARRPLPEIKPGEGPEQTAQRYHYNDGTSVYRKVFADAGYNPDTATSLPVYRQIGIVTQQMTQPETSHFRNVKVDQRAGPRQALNALMDLHRAGQDSMSALGLPHDLMGLQGTLGLNINAQMPKGTAAYYDPNTRTVHLSQDRTNSFGHEWIHALDHAMVGKLRVAAPPKVPLLSSAARATGLPAHLANDPVAKTFVNVLNKLFFNDADFALKLLTAQQDLAAANAAGNAKQAQVHQAEIDAMLAGAGDETKINPSTFRASAFTLSDPEYHGSAWELLARSGESFMASEATRSGMDPRGFTQPDEGYLADTNEALRRHYPQVERAEINNAWREHFDALAAHGMFASKQGPAKASGDKGGALGYEPKLPKNTPPPAFLARMKNARQHAINAGWPDPAKADPGWMTWQKRVADNTRYLALTKSGLLDQLVKQYKGNPDAQNAIQKLRDALSPPTRETGRYTGDSWEELSRRRAWSNLNTIANLLDNNGLGNKWIALQNARIRHALITGEDRYEGDKLQPNETRVVAKLREMFDEEYERNRRAGLNIGYARSGFLPIRYSHAAIAGDPKGFQADAFKLHQRMFDDRVGDPGDNPDKLYAEYRDIPKDDRDTLMDPGLRDNMNELGKTLARMRAQLKKLLTETDPTKRAAIQAKIDALEQHATDLATDNHHDMRDFYADQAAQQWRATIGVGHRNGFDTVGPTSNYLRKRVLPDYAQQVMEKWLHTDVVELTADYFTASARRTAHAELFGPADEKLENWISQAEEAGVHQSHIQLMRDVHNAVTGRGREGIPKKLMVFSNVTHALGNLLMLPRASWNALAEPWNAGMRNRSLQAALKSYTVFLRDLLGGQTAEERSETAEFLGIMSNHLVDSAMAMRAGDDYADTPRLGKLSAAFFRANLLTQITEWGRRAAFVANDWYGRKMARDLFRTDNKEKQHAAEVYFKEAGIPPAHHEAYAKKLIEWGGVPTVDQLRGDNTGMAGLYARHMNRVTDQSYQVSYKGDRPMIADTPLGRLPFQLMSFMWSFMRNIMNPLMESVGHTAKRAYSQARIAGHGPAISGAQAAAKTLFSGGHAVMLIGSLVGVTFIQSTLRELLFNFDTVKKHIDEGDLLSYLFDVAVQRSGINTIFDPLVQLWAAVGKYHQDPQSLLHGPVQNSVMRAFADALAPLIDDTDANSNTRYNKLVRAAYDVPMRLAISAATTLASEIAGPKLRVPIAGLQQWLTSGDASRAFANKITGPPGTKLEEPGKMPSPPEPPAPPKPGAEDKDTGGSSSALNGAAMGLADDFLPPALRSAAIFYQMVPGPVKAAIAAGAAVVGLEEFYRRMGPYREAAQDAP